jgi:hypothetical protein
MYKGLRVGVSRFRLAAPAATSREKRVDDARQLLIRYGFIGVTLWIAQGIWFDIVIFHVFHCGSVTSTVLTGKYFVPIDPARKQ